MGQQGSTQSSRQRRGSNAGSTGNAGRQSAQNNGTGARYPPFSTAHAHHFSSSSSSSAFPSANATARAGAAASSSSASNFPPTGHQRRVSGPPRRPSSPCPPPHVEEEPGPSFSKNQNGSKRASAFEAEGWEDLGQTSQNADSRLRHPGTGGPRTGGGPGLLAASQIPAGVPVSSKCLKTLLLRLGISVQNCVEKKDLEDLFSEYLASTPTKKMQKDLQSLGLNTSGCIEREDLVTLLRAKASADSGSVSPSAAAPAPERGPRPPPPTEQQQNGRCRDAEAPSARPQAEVPLPPSRNSAGPSLSSSRGSSAFVIDEDYPVIVRDEPQHRGMRGSSVSREGWVEFRDPSDGHCFVLFSDGSSRIVPGNRLSLATHLVDDPMWGSLAFVEKAPRDHKFGGKPAVPQDRRWTLQLKQQWRALQGGLPPYAVVQTFNDRMDLMRFVIRGSDRTPYERSLYFFDVFLPPAFPQVPPEVVFLTFGAGRLNPNLYADGKVCLSLLGTWSGPGWEGGKSTILQVILSLSGLVLTESPYVNEPAFDAQSGTAQSVAYNECVRHLVVQMTSGMLRRPPGGFEGLVRSFFRRRHALVCGRLVQAQEKRGSKKRKHDSGGVVRYFLLGATETMDPDADEKLIRDLNELLL